MSQGGLQPCPILTHSAVSLQEALQGEVPEIRAYKLGKRRWSYNQVELVLCEAGEGGRMLSVKQAVNTGTDNFKEEVRESAVSFQVQLANEYRVQVHAFLCYDAASLVEAGGSQHHSAGGAPGAAGSGGRGASGGGGASGSGQGSGSGAGRSQEEEQYEWTLVDRAACQKGCSGPVLRAIQRFGKLGKRAWGTSPSPDLTDRTNNNMKDPRYFYLSFDEAGTHVGVKSFRLVVAVYDQGGRRRLSTCVSPPIRVLANNDVPTGAAHILLHAQIPSSWEGWVGVPSSTEALPMLTPAANPPRHPHGARAAGSPVARTPAGRPRPTSSADSIDHSHHSSSGGEKRLRGSTLQGAHHHHHPHIKQEDFSQLEGRGGSDRRTRRRLSLGREDPDYVPRRGGAASYADVAPVRQLPPRRPNQMEHQHYDDSTPSGTPTQSLPSPGATNSNTSHQLAGAGGAGVGAHQPQGGASSLLGVFGLHQAQSSLGAQQAQQQLQMQQQAARSMLGPLDMDHYPLGLQGLDADLPLPQFLQSHPLSLGGAAGGTRSPVLSPYRQQQGGSGSPLRTSPDCRPAAAFGQPAQQQQQQQQAGGFPGLFIGQQQQQAEHGMAGLGLLPGGGRLAVSQAGHQPQIHLNLQQLQIHHQQQPLQQQQQLLQFQQQQQQQQAQLNLSSPHAPQQLLADLPGMAGGGGMGQLGLSQLQLPARSLMLPQGSLDPTSSGDDPITAFLEILMKSQAPGPGSPIVELPNLSPGGSPTKSPLRRHSAGLHLGASLHQAAAAGGGGNPSSLSNATAFLPGLQLPASPLSTQQPPQQAQQAAGGGAGSPAGGVQLQRQLLLASMHPPQLPPHAQLQQHSSRGLAAGVQLQLQQLQQQHQQQQRDQDQITSFGSTFNLFQEGGNAAGKAQLAQQQQHQHAQMAALQHHHQQQQQQQQQAELFFRRGPGLTNLAAEQAMAAPRMSPMQGKMDPSLMGAVGLDPSPAPPLSPPRLLQGSDLSPLRMAHSPNSISTPTPSALDDIFESFQPTLETAAEALMHGESAFAAAGIKQEPGVSSAVS